MKTPLQQVLAGTLIAGAAAVALAQQSAPDIPNATAPTSSTNPQASTEVQRNLVEGPVASVSAGAIADRAQAAQGLVEALNADASLKGSKLTVVPEENGMFITGVTPSLRQMAQIVNTATQQAGGQAVRHSISTEEVVIDVGASSAGPEAMIPPDEIRVDPPRPEDPLAVQPAEAAQPSQPSQPSQQNASS